MRARLAIPGSSCCILDPNHSGGRAKWPVSGYWTEPPICTGHMAIWQANVAAFRARANPMWFLGRKQGERR